MSDARYGIARLLAELADCALARVTASEFGRPAAGMAEAVALLKA